MDVVALDVVDTIKGGGSGEENVDVANVDEGGDSAENVEGGSLSEKTVLEEGCQEVKEWCENENEAENETEAEDVGE